MPTRDPLSAMSRQSRSQAMNTSTRVSRPSADSVRQQTNSLHAFVDNNELDGLIDHDNVSEAISTTIQPFDSSLLCVKAIIPSAGPSHANHHSLQHRWTEYLPLQSLSIFFFLWRTCLRSERNQFYQHSLRVFGASLVISRSIHSNEVEEERRHSWSSIQRRLGTDAKSRRLEISRFLPFSPSFVFLFLHGHWCLSRLGRIDGGLGRDSAETETTVDISGISHFLLR